MFSEELRELDKNTVKYMIEEQQKEIDMQREELRRKDEEIARLKKALEQTSKRN